MARKKKLNEIIIEDEIAKIVIDSPKYGIYYALIEDKCCCKSIPELPAIFLTKEHTIVGNKVV